MKSLYQPLLDWCGRLEAQRLEKLKENVLEVEKKVRMSRAICLEMIEKEKEEQGENAENYDNMRTQVSKNMSQVSKKIDDDRDLIDEYLKELVCVKKKINPSVTRDEMREILTKLKNLLAQMLTNLTTPLSYQYHECSNGQLAEGNLEKMYGDLRKTMVFVDYEGVKLVQIKPGMVKRASEFSCKGTG